MGVGILGVLGDVPWGDILRILEGMFPKVLSEEVLDSALSSACSMSGVLLKVGVRVPDGKILVENVLKILGEVLSEGILEEEEVLSEGILDECFLGILRRVLVEGILDKCSLGILKRILVGGLLASTLREIQGGVCVPDEKVLVEEALGGDAL